MCQLSTLQLLRSRLLLLLILVCATRGAVLAQTDSTYAPAPVGDTAAATKQAFNRAEDFPASGKVPHKYRMNYWTAGAFSLAATAANIYAIPNIIKDKPELTDNELKALNREQYNFIDRWALEQRPEDRETYYQYSDYLLPVIVASAATLGFDKPIRKDWARILMMYYEMHAVTFSTYNFSPFGPAFQNKYRPYVYYDYFPADERRGGNQRNSLYSGHTASASAATFFMVKVYSDYHPEIGNKKYLLYALASVPPLVEGYLRMKALAHFPSDILVGYVVGGAIGVIVPEMHRYKNKNLSFGLVPTPAGPGIHIGWQPMYKDRKIGSLLAAH